MKSFVFILISTLLITSCSLFKEVEVIEVEGYELIELSEENVEIWIDVKVNNPNGFKIKLVDSDINIFINGTDLGKLKLREKLILPKNSVSVQKLKVIGDPQKIQEGIMANAMSFLFSKTALVEATGSIKGRALGFGKKVDVEYKEEINISDLDLGF